MRQQKVSARRGHKRIAKWDMRAEERVRAYSKRMVDAVVQVVLSPRAKVEAPVGGAWLGRVSCAAGWAMSSPRSLRAGCLSKGKRTSSGRA